MDGLDRLYHLLVRNLGTGQFGAGEHTLTVGDIYQQVAPFRANRTQLGFAELAGYERALVRLLTGERGYLQIEDSRIRDELQNELDSPNPILGLYRDYASATVHLNREVVVEERQDVPEPLPLLDEPDPAPTQEAAKSCWSCMSMLPQEVDAKFCPFCGTVQQAVPCARCEAPLEPEWRFCAQCGLAREPQPI